MYSTTAYDPQVMEQAADKLYDRARTLVAGCAFLGIVVGFMLAVPGFAAYVWMESYVSLRRADVGLAHFWILATLFSGGGFFVGYSIGQSKAFNLRLEAQRTLCQLRIERQMTIAATALEEERQLRHGAFSQGIPGGQAVHGPAPQHAGAPPQ